MTIPCRAGLPVRPPRNQPRAAWVSPVPGKQEGLQWQRPVPFSPSLSLGPSSPGAARAIAIPRPTNQIREKKALSQDGISVPVPAPVPLVPRPGAASSSQRWGWRVRPEGGGEDPGASCPPPSHPALPCSLLGLRAGPPGGGRGGQWYLKLTDLPVLPACWRKRWSWPGSWLRSPNPSSPCPRSSGAWCPTKPSLSLQGPQFQKKEEHENQDAGSIT